MAGSGRGISLRDIAPLGAGAQHPQDTVEHLPVIAPGTAASIRAYPGLRDQRLENRPLLVREVHASLLGAFQAATGKQVTSLHPFVRQLLNFSISFEEALKLELALRECLSKLNKYNRSTTAGRRTALLLTAHLEVKRFAVLEGKLSE